jgi:hypothetical protein
MHVMPRISMPHQPLRRSSDLDTANEKVPHKIRYMSVATAEIRIVSPVLQTNQ